MFRSIVGMLIPERSRFSPLRSSCSADSSMLNAACTASVLMVTSELMSNSPPVGSAASSAKVRPEKMFSARSASCALTTSVCAASLIRWVVNSGV